MATITINGTEYPVYADLAAADDYAQAGIHADGWLDDPDEDRRARALVTATRLLDRQRWRGERTDPTQELEWPRTGISGVPDDELPGDLVAGAIELAIALHAGSEVQDRTTTENDVKNLRAGSVSLEFFRGIPPGTRFPTIVQELVGRWLRGAGLRFPSSMAFGTDRKTTMDQGYGLTGGI